MNHSDVITLLVAAITTCGTCFGIALTWLLRHGSRLTGAEVRLQSLAENAENDRRRNDTQWSEVRGTLARIEDKLDRKADR